MPIIRNPQALNRAAQSVNQFLAGPTQSATGEPLRVRITSGATISIIESGPARRAQASTGQETQPSTTQSNSSLINSLISEFFPNQVVTEILEQAPAAQVASNQTPQNPEPSDIGVDNTPLDQRLVYLVDDKTGAVVYSLGTDQEKELVDGFVISSNPSAPEGAAKVSANSPDVDTSNMTPFYGVPSLMNENAYINLQAAGGKGNNKYLIDRENQPRFYDASNPSTSDLGAAKTPTTTNIINWSQQESNRYKFPYKYQDFVFCKWWQKVPNNYMITLRRYPYPTNDAVTSSSESRNELKPENLYPVATMVTFLGEEPGNKISEIISMESSLKWRDIDADVWEVSQSTDPASVNNPAPGLAKALGFLTQGAAGVKDQRVPLTPIDPYNNGPYVNKIIGPVNVITQTKARDRGLEFKHEISLTFEYSVRSIGGVNSKAAALDIIGNTLLMASASAAFWGGMNRFAPHVNQGAHDPFLGGAAGRDAWVRGNPSEFFDALREQFTQILGNVSDFFNKITQDPIGGLKEIAGGAATEFMKLSTTASRGQVSGLHSLLTGAPVGEWHLQVGSPLNPIMMIGNLICTGVKLEFNDELGPDDFPTEIKATISLEHGMPRDKDAIESMFNKGLGRIYALPKGYENTLYSSRQSNIDTSTGTTTETQGALSLGAISANEAGRGGQGSRRSLVGGRQVDRAQRPGIVGGEVAYEQLFSFAKIAKKPLVRSQKVSLYGLGTSVTNANTASEGNITRE